MIPDLLLMIRWQQKYDWPNTKFQTFFSDELVCSCRILIKKGVPNYIFCGCYSPYESPEWGGCRWGSLSHEWPCGAEEELPSEEEPIWTPQSEPAVWPAGQQVGRSPVIYTFLSHMKSNSRETWSESHWIEQSILRSSHCSHNLYSNSVDFLQYFLSCSASFWLI